VLALHRAALYQTKGFKVFACDVIGCVNLHVFILLRGLFCYLDCSIKWGDCQGKTAPKCHPERRGISPQSGEMERSRTFAGRGCDICNLLQKSAPQQAKAQIFAKGECAAGSVMGFLYVCLTYELFSRFVTRLLAYCRK
jgi:hypothetical protein